MGHVSAICLLLAKSRREMSAGMFSKNKHVQTCMLY